MSVVRIRSVKEMGEPVKMEELFGEGAGFIFALKLIPTIIFILILVNILYYYGIMQRVVEFCAKIMYKLMNVSGAESLSNIASAFVGQVEAQIMIKPYLATMTMSELLASMTGSMACIAGGVMAMYVGMGIPAEYLLAASIMAASSFLSVSSYPLIYSSIGSPSGAVFISVTTVSGVSPISRKCLLVVRSPPTFISLALSPTLSSLNFIKYISLFTR